MFLIDGCPCLGTTIPMKVIELIRLVYNGIKIVVPIILIITGMIDMVKVVSAKNESEIKKAQNLLVKKTIAAALVFLMLALVNLVVTSTTSTGKSEMECVKCILGD